MPPSRKIAAVIDESDARTRAVLEQYAPYIRQLAGLETRAAGEGEDALGIGHARRRAAARRQRHGQQRARDGEAGRGLFG